MPMQAPGEPTAVPAPNAAPNTTPDPAAENAASEAATDAETKAGMAADAAADFDNDGLTTLQEYQLHGSSSGASGNPLGNWSVKGIPLPDPGAADTW